MAVPPDLSLDDCRLLRAEDGGLIDTYNKVAQHLRRLEQDHPKFASALQNPVAVLSKVAGILTRSFYRVGFLGTSQAGKSTTFNNLLEVSEDESPAGLGKSGATTSCITRLRAIQTGQHTLELVYLTPEQYLAKRTGICTAVEINPARPDSEVHEELRKSRDAINAGQKEGLIKDVEDLGAILESHKLYHDKYIKSLAFQEKHAYERRPEFLNHPPDKANRLKASPRWLLKEAVIQFHTSKVPETLEMIDLPGLGTRGTIDSLLTLDFLKDLDGALLFLKADKTDDPDLEEIITKLKPTFKGRWKKRMWIIVTKFDSLTRHHFVGDNTYFDTLKAMLTDHQLGAENVWFTSNQAYARVQEGSPAAELLPLKRDNPVYSRYPEFNSALDALYHDGGISALRTLVKDHLARAVAAAIREEVAVALESLQSEVERIESNILRQANQSIEEYKQAKECWEKVVDLLVELRGRPKWLTEPAQNLLQSLTTRFTEVATTAERYDFLLQQNGFAALENRFLLETEQLDKGVTDIILDKIVDPLYQLINDRLKEAPAYPVLGAPSPVAAWQKFLAADAREKAWLEGFPRFHSRNLFAQMKTQAADVRGFQGKAYLKVLGEKIRLTTNQVVHAVRDRLNCRLTALQMDLAMLTDNKMTNGNSD